MKKGELEAIAQRWSERARNGEWAKVLADSNSYVNTDSAYEKFRLVADYALETSKQTAILDLGCGTCDMWETFKKHCSENNLYGLDFAEGMIEIARERFPNANLFVEDALNLEKVIPEGKKFSAVVSRGVLINHLGMEYFGKILDAVHPYTNGLLAFDYLNKEWFTEDKFIPKKPLFTAEEVASFVRRTKFNDHWIAIHDVYGRDPITVLTKNPLDLMISTTQLLTPSSQ